MESDELPSVQCNDCSSALHRELQYFVVGDPLVRLSGLMSREHVMSEPPESLNDFERDILVRVQRSQGLCSLVLADRLFDVLAVRINVGPGVDQVRRAEAGKIRQYPRLSPALSAVSL